MIFFRRYYNWTKIFICIYWTVNIKFDNI